MFRCLVAIGFATMVIGAAAVAHGQQTGGGNFARGAIVHADESIYAEDFKPVNTQG